jgi:hypothetical protein
MGFGTMDKHIAEEIIACMPQGRTLFYYFKDRYALLLFSRLRNRRRPQGSEVELPTAPVAVHGLAAPLLFSENHADAGFSRQPQDGAQGAENRARALLVSTNPPV